LGNYIFKQPLVLAKVYNRGLEKSIFDHSMPILLRQVVYRMRKRIKVTKQAISG